jgi:hypothetical protein
MGMNESGLKELAARMKYSMAKLMKELESQVEEAQRMHSQADDAEDPDAELETRIYLSALQGSQEAVQDAHHYAKYLLADLDAAGELELNTRGRFELPTADGRDTFEFSCGCGIEILDEKEQRWMYGNVEYADKYEHGYYFKPGGIALQPGIKARHRCINPWDD